MESGNVEDLAALLRSIGRELFQTEKSAATHSRREARRLGATPPAAALLRVAEHAERVGEQLITFAPDHGMPVSQAGTAVGALFSAARELVADRLIRSERSYRGTLIGIRHGLDLVQLLRHVAQTRGDQGLEAWCETWLSERTPLAKQVEEELRWFAAHPHHAMKLARPLSLSVRRKEAETATA